jgi:hypothetical protein
VLFDYLDYRAVFDSTLCIFTYDDATLWEMSYHTCSRVRLLIDDLTSHTYHLDLCLPRVFVVAGFAEIIGHGMVFLKTVSNRTTFRCFCLHDRCHR